MSMPRLIPTGNPITRLLVATLAGLALCLAFAPFGQWWLSLVCPAVLMALWQDATPRQAAATGFWFNAGLYGGGTYWLYIAIHENGNAPVWIAAVVMGGLVAVLAAYGALLGYLSARLLPARGAVRWLAGLPAAWLLVEWFRGWFLTGFPWLSLGYAHTDTWLAGMAPVAGVYGVSALVLLDAGALVTLWQGTARERLLAVTVIVLSWGVPLALRGVAWTRVAGSPVSVAIVQGAVPQDEKWQEGHRDEQLAIYHDLTLKALGTQVIVWPEAAPPDIAQNLQDYLLDLYHQAHARGSALVIGVLRQNPEGDYYNSILGMSDEVGWYDKRHLVPFTEVFPVPQFARDWLRFMKLPFEGFNYGAARQPPLSAGPLVLAPAICYDDAYGSSDLEMLRTANALVTVTNDGWFGHSTARYQHLQIARMRAIEAGRPALRAANDGISAIIGPDGRVQATAPGYVPYVLRARITPRIGLPPYARTGNWLIICLAAVTLIAAVMAGRMRGTFTVSMRSTGPLSLFPRRSRT